MMEIKQKLTAEESDLIWSRRHPLIAERLDIISLISDSYVGGEKYLKGGHLFQYPNENKFKYRARLRRSSYWNFVQPIADMLVGFIYEKEPDRNGYEDVAFLLDKASKRKSLNSFMETVAVYSLLFSCGVLVNSPDFDEGHVKTAADEQELGLNPYCVLYRPEKIRDFCVNDNGELEWIELDDSYIEKTNPFTPPKEVKAYSIWTKSDFYTIEFEDNDPKKGYISQYKKHDLGSVPFIFCNSKDVDDDNITESIFEDIALTSRSIFNLFSYLEEMSASSTFQVLMFPVDSPKNLPKTLLQKGLGALPVVPTPLKSKPYFDGAKIEGADTVIRFIEMLVKSILQKVGFDKESEQNYVQSGVAKKIEFQKTESMLRLLATQLEEVEKKIFYFARKWRPGSSTLANKETVVTYNKKFQSEELEKKLKRLWEVFDLSITKLQSWALEKIIKVNFPDKDEKEIKSILTQFEKDAKKQSTSLDINELVSQEKSTRNNTQSSDMGEQEHDTKTVA